MDFNTVKKQLEEGKAFSDLPLRVTFYARVSTDRDEQLNSLDNQVTHYTKIIGENENWTLVDRYYVDEGISGTSVFKRDDFLKMIADAKKHKFDCIYTKSVARFARDVLDAIKYTRELAEYGVTVVFENDAINTASGDGELRLSIMATLAQEEMRKLSANVKFGMERAYESGKVLGSDNIYGYDKKDGKLVENKVEAEFVRALFALYEKGKCGYRVAARMLYEQGYRNQSGGEINPGSLKGILTNPKYKGFYCGRKTESSDYRTKKNIKKPKEQQLLYKDENIPVIIPEEQWDRVNAVLLGRAEKFKQNGRGAINSYSYSGKIICEEHGTPHYRKMWNDRKIPAESWCCKVYMAKGRKACPTPHLYTRDLESILEYIGKDLLDNREKYVKQIEGLIDLYRRANQDATDYDVEISKLNARIEKAKKAQNKLLKLYTDDKIEEEQYLRQNNQEQVTIKKLMEQVITFKAKQSATDSPEMMLDEVRTFLSGYAEQGLGAIDVAREMLDTVLVLKGSTRENIKLRITMKYGEQKLATILRTNILYGATEVSPIVGTERQSEELIKSLMDQFENDPQKIWQSNMFGKSLEELVKEGLQNKLFKMPEDVQEKLQRTLQKIINEGNGGLICIIL